MPRPTTYFHPDDNALQNLTNHRIILALTFGRISGADVFSIELLRQLQKQGLSAEIVRTTQHERVSDPLQLPNDISFQTLPVSARATWQTRWQAMTRYLEERAPCIYLPNYDWRHSCISPTLSPRVKIVGIAHSDDAQHYEHVERLGRYWDGIVAVSRVIAERITLMQPELAQRLYTIPYGVHVPSELSAQKRVTARAGAQVPLRMVYAGRLIQHQKRVMDLPRIASALAARNIPFELTVIGSGPDQAALHQASAKLMRDGKLRFLGSLSNARVLEIFAASDVFILTSDFEGLPVSMLEAMAHGCVPVVTRVSSGVPEMIQDGVNGFTVPIGEIDAFVNCLARLQSDTMLRQHCAANAHRLIHTGGYRLEDMAASYINLFQTMVAQDFQRPPGNILPPPGMNITPPSLLGRFSKPVWRIVWRAQRRLQEIRTRAD